MPSRRALLPACAAALTIASIACTKSESGGPAPGDSAIATTVAAASTTPPASATAATAAPSAAASAEGAAADSAATPKSSPPAGAKTDDAGAATAAAPAECGTKPLPDCPLQAWMKANANPPMMQNDLPALAIALDKIVALAPPGYTNWSSIAKDGAAAARSGDLTATKASCRTCHDQYKQKYKTELRARKI